MMLLRVLFCVVFCTSAVLAQSPQEFMFLPEPMESGDMRFMLGSTITFVPRPIAEEEIRQIPAIDIRTRFGLPLGLSLLANVNSNYITNVGTLGAQWSVDVLGVSVAVGDKHSIWYGIATLDGFDVDAIGWFNSPHVSVGTSFGEIHTSLTGELLYLTSRSTRAGDVEVGADANRVLGGSVALYVEQPFVKRTHLVLGLKINSLTSAYQSWLAFATFGDRLFYPEFTVGVLL